MLELLARRWWALALRGVVAVLFGLLTLFIPGVTLISLVMLFGFYAISIALTLAAGWAVKLGLLFWPLAAFYAFTLVRQPLRLKLDDPAGALALFQTNTRSGFILFLAIAAGFWRL